MSPWLLLSIPRRKNRGIKRCRLLFLFVIMMIHSVIIPVKAEVQQMAEKRGEAPLVSHWVIRLPPMKINVR
jgi:hypothetical protein